MLLLAPTGEVPLRAASKPQPGAGAQRDRALLRFSQTPPYLHRTSSPPAATGPESRRASKCRSSVPPSSPLSAALSAGCCGLSTLSSQQITGSRPAEAGSSGRSEAGTRVLPPNLHLLVAYLGHEPIKDRSRASSRRSAVRGRHCRPRRAAWLVPAPPVAEQTTQRDEGSQRLCEAKGVCLLRHPLPKHRTDSRRFAAVSH